MHWAAHGHTTAEVIAQRADSKRPNMGLTTWKNAPAGPLRKGDVAIAKNYLAREELEALNLIVSAYLDFAELQARSHRPMHMADWIGKLDDFIRLSDHEILDHAGRVSHRQAEDHAHAQYEAFERQRREFASPETSDFDEAARRLTEQAFSKKPRGQKKKIDEQVEGE
jgi:hypothetical protein